MKGKKYDFDTHKLWWHLEDVLKWKNGKLIVPLQIDLGATLLCNQNCVYCLYQYRQKDVEANPKKYSLSREVYLKLMKDAGRLGVKSIAMVGDGENFAHPDTPEAIITGFKAGLDIGIATNGVNLRDAWLEDVLRSLTWIRFSICAWGNEMAKAVHRGKSNDFDVANSNLEECVRIKREKKLKVDVGICYLLIPNMNLDGLLPMVKHARRIGVDYMYIKQFLACGKNEWNFPLELYDRCEKALKEAETYSSDSFACVVRWHQIKHRGEKIYKHCYAPRFIMNVSGDGNIYTCGPYHGMEKFCYGNLYESDLETILRSNRRFEVSKYIEQEFDAQKQCDSLCCRHHPINTFLWQQLHPPDHVNFP